MDTPEGTAPADEVVAEWRPTSSSFLVAGLLLGLAYTTLLALRSGFAGPTPADPASSVLLGGATVAIVLLAARVAWAVAGLRTVLTREVVRIHSSKHDWAMRLDTVRAVWVTHGRRWAVVVIPADGMPLLLGVPSYVFAWRWQTHAVPSPAYWDAVASSPAGRAAQAIHAAAAAAQPSEGPLDTAPPIADLLHVVRPPGSFRCWSASGETCSAT